LGELSIDIFSESQAGTRVSAFCSTGQENVLKTELHISTVNWNQDKWNQDKWNQDKFIPATD
jgi:hypothetical protein